MKKRNTLSSLIWKLVFWLIEIGAVFVFISAAKSIFTGDSIKGTGFIGAIFVSIMGAYVIFAPVIVIVWIFNFVTEFDDFDGFSEGIKGILISPVTMIKHIVGHAVFIFGYAMGLIFHGKKGKSYSNGKKRSSGSNGGYNNVESKDNRKEFPNYLTDILDKAAADVAHTTNPANLYDRGIDTSWDGRLEAFVSSRKITFTGTVVYQAKSYSPDDVDKNDIEYCESITASTIKSKMEKEIREIRKTYKGYDDSYNIIVNLSARIV